MAEQDLAQGIEALQDEEVRARVAAGDVAAAGALELTEEEQELLIAAASDEAEVVGFGINTSLLGFGPVGHKGSADISQDVTVNKAKTADKAAQAMHDYLRG